MTFEVTGDVWTFARHIEICAVRMLAGLLEPHAPLPKGKPGL